MKVQLKTLKEMWVISSSGENSVHSNISFPNQEVMWVPVMNYLSGKEVILKSLYNADCVANYDDKENEYATENVWIITNEMINFMNRNGANE